MKKDINTKEDLFEMANIRPSSTGLPMVIWIKPKTNERHGPRIKVQKVHGSKVNVDNMASVSISDNPELKAGGLNYQDFKLVSKFVKTYKVWLLQVWHDEIDSTDFVLALKSHKKGRLDNKNKLSID